jgi:thioredoxin 1
MLVAPRTQELTMAELEKVDDAHFTAEVLESDVPVLVDFTAAWCAPCRIMKPVLAELADERPDIRFVSVDVDENPVSAATFGVMSMPTLMLFRGGEPVQTLIGARPKGRLASELPEGDPQLLAQ